MTATQPKVVGTSANPNGIASISPGLRAARYPGSRIANSANPERVASKPHSKRGTIRAIGYNPFRVDDGADGLPSVAPASQRRADGWNPVGILRATCRPEGKRGHVRALQILLALLLAGCTPSEPPPPTVALTSVDPSLATVITTARQNVLGTPQSAEAWGRFGQALHAAEFYPEARASYAHALKLEPRSARWAHLLGVLQLQEQPDAALENLSLAASLAGAQIDAPRVRLAQALIERGRFEDAVKHIDLLLAANPLHAAARLEMARVHLSRQALERAEDSLQPCLTNSFTARPSLLLLAQIRQRQGIANMATQISRRAAGLARPFDWPDPFLREVQTLRGDRQKLEDQVNALLVQRRLPEAEAALAKLLSTFPEDAGGLLLLGRLRYQEKKCAEAEEALRRHLTAQPNSLNGLMQLGLAQLCQEHWTNAIATLRQAVTIKPDFAQAQYNLGYAYARFGDAASAIRSYRDALRATPGDPSIHLALAEELFHSGQRTEALANAERAAALNPNDPRARLLRDRIHAAK